MKTTERSKLIIQRRIAGAEYKELAAELGMKIGAVRMACLRAMWRGVVTPEQIRFSPTIHIPSDEEYNAEWLRRLAAKSVTMPSGCIEMPGVFHNEDGYAHLSHRALGNFAHRIVTILKKGPIPLDKMACHRCGNHGCVNDAHLYVGTMKQNARDTVNMGRHLEANKTECIHGHPFDGANTRICSKGKRHCKTCEKAIAKKPSVVAWRREYQAKRRALKRAGKLGEVSP